jgi:hypothetical protein
MLRKIYNIIPPLLYFIFLFFDLSLASLIEKEPYVIQGKRDYKDTLNILIVPFKGHVSEQRAYARDLVYKILRDRILSYGRVRLSRALLHFERKPFDPMGKKAPIQAGENRFLELRVLDWKSIAEKREGEFPDSAISSIAGKDADVVLTGEVVQRSGKLAVAISVSHRIYGKEFTIVREGSFKGINSLLDEIASETIKAIIFEYAFLTINTDPVGAALYVDKRYMGRSNRSSMVVESGHHELLIKKDGLEEKRIEIFIPSRETRSINVSLSEKRDTIAKEIIVVTHPEEARVYLDSEFIGYSPVKLGGLYSGVYRIRVEKRGYITLYRTISSEDVVPGKLELYMRRGSDEDYYFSRTTVYQNLFQLSFLGSAAGLISWFYFDLRIEEERAKVRGFQYDDPINPTPEEINAYDKMKERRDDRISRFEIYRDISLYSAAALLVSAGIFYYLDLMQDDIEIAFYYFPEYISVCRTMASERCPYARKAGIVVTLRF